MATTKQLLERAILKIGADAGAPSSDSPIEIYKATTTSASNNVYYTPATDGYIFVDGQGGSSEEGWVGVYCAGYGVNSNRGKYGYAVRSLTRVARGKSCSFFWKNMTSLTVYFKKSIGGGIRLLKRFFGVEVQYGYA